MWAGILFVGAVMAVGTLPVLDTSLSGGLIGSTGDMRYAQTMGLTIRSCLLHSCGKYCPVISFSLHVL